MNYTITDIVKNDLCTGCGICISESTSSQMVWDEYGFLVPDVSQSFSDKAIKLCPFNPNPEEEVQDEDKLAELFFKESKNIDDKIGRFENTYVGYANQYRETSSSGGIATFVFEQLLKQEIVNHLFIVKEINGTYQYQWFNNAEQIKQISKTRYIPVTLEKLFQEIDDKEGKVAVSGVACFVKAIRLKQHYYPQYKEKIPFVVGIICGGLKSRFFTDYLVQKTGINGEYAKQDYRIKDPKSTASDYSFGAFDEKQEFHQLKMKEVGDMWGTGMFKSNACDFCDDVTTELAEISLGDAWLQPYTRDGLGTSVIITRTSLADQLIILGVSENKLIIDKISLKNVKISQQGSFNHRHAGLFVRLNIFQKRNKLKLIRRFGKEKVLFDFKIVQLLRMEVRKKSLYIWKDVKNAVRYDKRMKLYLFLLKTATRINHHRKKLQKTR